MMEGSVRLYVHAPRDLPFSCVLSGLRVYLTYLLGRCRPPANHTRLCGSPVTMKQARPIKRALGCGRGGGSWCVFAGVPLQQEGEEALARRSLPLNQALGYCGTEVQWKTVPRTLQLSLLYLSA